MTITEIPAATMTKTTVDIIAEASVEDSNIQVSEEIERSKDRELRHQHLRCLPKIRTITTIDDHTRREEEEAIVLEGVGAGVKAEAEAKAEPVLRRTMTTIVEHITIAKVNGMIHV
mmetsp:Transcript_24712/g.58018  ORF Transcript_24712/g.58018 Transcript_24712/m.58018 type:complete len:116 (-) Transcript_24712:3412-3759(-)